jgi:hypothetical protein
MGSPLFNMFNPGPQVLTGNPLLNFLGNMPGGQNALMSVQQLMQQTQQSPEQIVRGMLQSGRISQDQFNRAAQMANMITGKKF